MLDSLNHDGLQDPVSKKLMGEATDAGNAERGITREEQDAVAARSHQRAEAARAAGIMAEEIAPIEIPQRKGPAMTLEHDEGIRPDTTAESLAQLRPAFSKAETATITAGSSSPLSDGAAALVIASKAAAEAAGLEWIAEIGAHGQTAGPDGSLHSQPAPAIVSSLLRCMKPARAPQSARITPPWRWSGCTQLRPSSTMRSRRSRKRVRSNSVSL